MGLTAPAADQPTAPAGTSATAAADYDAWFQAPWGRYAFAVESAAVLEAAGALGGARVLDVGCGTGRLTGAIQQAGASVVGVDLDPDMLTVAAANLAGPRLVADAQRLPFATGAFDLTVPLTLLEFVDDPARVVAELARVTRPGGRLLIAALNRASPWGLAHHRRLRRPPWTAARGSSPAARWSRCPPTRPTSKAVAALLQAQGVKLATLPGTPSTGHCSNRAGHPAGSKRIGGTSLIDQSFHEVGRQSACAGAA
jgi:SAM-dependent methyltransferase